MYPARTDSQVAYHVCITYCTPAVNNAEQLESNTTLMLQGGYDCLSQFDAKRRNDDFQVEGLVPAMGCRFKSCFPHSCAARTCVNRRKSFFCAIRDVVQEPEYEVSAATNFRRGGFGLLPRSQQSISDNLSCRNYRVSPFEPATRNRSVVPRRELCPFRLGAKAPACQNRLRVLRRLRSP
jgi:hypothetical protein